MGKPGLLIDTKGVQRNRKGLHPLGKEGLLIKKQGSGKIGWEIRLGTPGLLIYTKGSGTNRKGAPLGKRRCAYRKTWVWKNLVGKPIGETRLAYS